MYQLSRYLGDIEHGKKLEQLILKEKPDVIFSGNTPLNAQEIAIKAAISAMDFCREGGYQVGVSVVDRFGLTQAFIKSRYAGLHVQETATRKAWTSVSFRTPTLSLDESTQPGKEAFGIRFISKPLPLGGGVPIEAEGSIVAGIGSVRVTWVCLVLFKVSRPTWIRPIRVRRKRSVDLGLVGAREGIVGYERVSVHAGHLGDVPIADILVERSRPIEKRIHVDQG